ncbi:MAG: hypothetical protein CMF50_05080 [Legionellales bacterium]|nr:hypothetical protein [Legionellales bacterium]|tara:strand:+ start:66249 stop:66848 length:600 start_codon:yes stop_codon:yes gene_type:complete
MDRVVIRVMLVLGMALAPLCIQAQSVNENVPIPVLLPPVQSEQAPADADKPAADKQALADKPAKPVDKVITPDVGNKISTEDDKLRLENGTPNNDANGDKKANADDDKTSNDDKPAKPVDQAQFNKDLLACKKGSFTVTDHGPDRIIGQSNGDCIVSFSQKDQVLNCSLPKVAWTMAAEGQDISIFCDASKKHDLRTGQ